jgi:hypothetical protein
MTVTYPPNVADKSPNGRLNVSKCRSGVATERFQSDNSALPVGHVYPCFPDEESKINPSSSHPNVAKNRVRDNSTRDTCRRHNLPASPRSHYTLSP